MLTNNEVLKVVWPQVVQLLQCLHCLEVQSGILV